MNWANRSSTFLRGSVHQGKVLDNSEIEIKLAKLEKVLPVLLWAPYTKIFFLAGSVAAGLAQPQSDIDLIVVAQNNRVWLSKFFLEILARIFKIKRAKNNSKNKICFNIFLTNSRPLLPHRDAVGADCYKNLKPVWGRAEEIENFWQVNSWIEKFVDASSDSYRKTILLRSDFLRKSDLMRISLEKILTFSGLGFILEKIFYKIQTGYLKNKFRKSAGAKDVADYDFFITPDLIAYHFPVSNYARARQLAKTVVENQLVSKN